MKFKFDGTLPDWLFVIVIAFWYLLCQYFGKRWALKYPGMVRFTAEEKQILFLALNLYEYASKDPENFDSKTSKQQSEYLDRISALKEKICHK